MRKVRSAHDRFWEKVNSSGDCWEWASTIMPNGYGQFWLNGKHVYAHRAVLMLNGVEIPIGAQVDHMCFNRRCVRPEHLRVVTPTENQRSRRGANRNSRSGVRGVFWNKQRGRWQVSVSVGGSDRYGGLFDDLDDADRAAQALRAELYGAAGVGEQ